MNFLNVKHLWRYVLAIILGITLVWQQSARHAAAAVQRVKITSGSSYLIVEALNDNLVHFELSGIGPGPSASVPIYTSPMVAKTDYTGPTTWSDTTAGSVRTLQTPNVKVDVNTSTLCATVTDKVRVIVLSTYCPLNLSQPWKGLTMTPQSFTHGYGLGAQYLITGSADGDWVSTPGHQVRTSGDANGNQMVSWNGGAVGNTQFPIFYALGSGSNNYAMFLDNYYKQQWTFNTNPWKVEMWGDWIRWYVMVGPNLPTLRQNYMELVGRPLVPPKKTFGLWVSEYGYENWTELNGKLTGLINGNFPVDGFVLDLQWFGGVTSNSENSMMGNLNWDPVNFPNASTQISTYKNTYGIGIMNIEESYIAKGRPEWTTMNNGGWLVREGCSSCPAMYIGDGDNTWWGRGGMIDWTNIAGSDWWHDNKRQALINAGVIGHWLDLNEPEIYHAGDWYTGFDPMGLHNEPDIHNMFAFFQVQSVARGYTRNNVTQRLFMMTRSGAPGIQRYGATQWSADIGSNYTSLATWNNVQMHMVLSGIDYYSSDIGGFHRTACGSGCDINDLYTQWYATGMMFDIPGRPHTDNTSHTRETSPAAIGKIEANRANTQRRYELSPYLYSLAYRAWLYGEPVVPPLVYYYQTDPNVRTMGHEKLIGRDLLAAIVAGQGEFKRDVYLPAGDWVYFDSNEWFHSTGQTFTGIPEYRGYNLFRLPLFARAGAIIPTMYVDNQTANVLGFRRDGTTRNELIVRTYASPTATNFTLYEDDGTTKSYTTGSYRTTLLSQQKTSSTSETVTIAASSGTYTGAPSSRNNVISLVVENQQATAVTLNGSPLTQYTTKAAFDAASSGWFNAGYNLIQAKSGSMSVTTAKTFVFTLTSATAQASVNFTCANGTTTSGQSVFVVGNIPALGNWNTMNAVKLDPNVYPTWTGVIQGLPTGTAIQWKCIKRNNGDNGNLVWEPGSNNTITTPSSGFGGTTTDGGF